MNIGERIKIIRQLRNMTQQELGSAVGLNATRIGHYEMNFRKPKKETLKAIADALRVGISVFEDIELETLSDVEAILFQLDDKVGITFHGEKDDDDKYIRGTVSLSFDNPQIATFLKEWADWRTNLSEFERSSKKYDKQTQENVKAQIAEMKNAFENTSLTTYNSAIIVSKHASNNIKVKLSPWHKHNDNGNT